MDTRVFGTSLIASNEIAGDRHRTLPAVDEGAYYAALTPKDRRFLRWMAALVAVFVFGVASADMHGTRSLSPLLAPKADPFVAGYTEEHPALPLPYAELPMRHYLVARDPMTGVNLTLRDLPAPVVAGDRRVVPPPAQVSTDGSRNASAFRPNA
jgi:hypothetical protein